MKPLSYLRDEKGLILVVALMLLITLTVMGLAAISTTSTEIKISGNERINARAFHAAEAGVKEMLYRMALPDGMGAIDVAQGGSQVTVEGGYSFDASLADPGWSPAGCVSAPCPNPNWAASIFFTGNEPADPNANADYTRTILPNNVWGSLSYATGDTNTPELAVAVRYARESDYNGIVSNGDSDNDDLVFFDFTGVPLVRRAAADNGAGGDEDYNPPGTLTKANAIRLISATGRFGNARKTIALELTEFAIDPNVDGAMTVGFPVRLRGSAFVSGFNHLPTTTRTDENNTAPGNYQTDDCSSLNTDGGNSACGLATDPNAGDLSPYSGSLAADGHKPGIYYEPAEDPDTGGSSEVWGGDFHPDLNQRQGWKGTDAGWTFPTLAQMLGLAQETVDDLLANANVTNANADTVCPQGVTYVQLSPGQEYKPSQVCDSGSGLVVVEGDFRSSSQFEFRGLIYVTGDAHIRGGTWILGALAVKGDTTNLSTNLGTGNTTYLYSEQTIVDQLRVALAQAGFSFTVLSWKEM